MTDDAKAAHAAIVKALDVRTKTLTRDERRDVLQALATEVEDRLGGLAIGADAGDAKPAADKPLDVKDGD